MRISLPRIVLTGLFAVQLCQSAITAQTFGTDLKGRPVRDLAGTGTRYVVLMFAASDCPICNRYVPEIARLAHEYSSRGVRIWWVFPNPEDTLSVVAKHNQEFSIREQTVLDTQQTLVHLAHVTVTPEAAVFKIDEDGMHEIYSGRIDDRYLAIGKEKPQPDHHDLELALTAALNSQRIPQPVGPPVGCSVVFLQK
jgi:thiol-disulfide isomerase/thioredoxin